LVLTTSGNHDSTRSDRIYMPRFPSPLLTIEGSLLNQAGYKDAFFTYFLKSVIQAPTRIAIYGSVHRDTWSYFPGSKKVGFCPLVSANLPEVHSSLGRSFGPRVSLCLPPFSGSSISVPDTVRIIISVAFSAPTGSCRQDSNGPGKVVV
jgi:hypothetical protein